MTTDQWLMNYAATGEDKDATRKMLLRMTLPEVRAVIALRQKKAAEARAKADRLQSVVDAMPPGWHDDPSLTVADILGIHE